jgi:hypothetical protein
VSRFPPPKAIAFVLGLKLYVLLLLYALYLKTDLRNGDKGFIFRPTGQSFEERSKDIEGSFIERLAPYDGQWYLDIAENGYRTLSKAETMTWQLPPGNYAFFPLLPGILSGAKQIAGGAGLAVTLVFLMALSVLGGVLVWVLARDLRINPYLTDVLLVGFPTAVFQFALYTEGIFLFLSALTLIAALRRKPDWAALAGFLAGLSRPQGVLLILPLFVELLLPAIQKRETCSKADLFGRVLAVLTPFSGVLVLAASSIWVTGSATSFLAIQGRWGRSLDLRNLVMVFGYGGPPADLIGLGFGLLLLPVLWRKLPLSLALYGTAMLLLPLSTGSLMSLGRFLSVSIPHFLALATCQVLVANGLIAWYLVG